MRVSFFRFIPCLIFAALLLEGCSAPKPKKALTISEQIEVDTKAAEDLEREFEKKVSFVNFPEGERFITGVARRIAKVQDGFSTETVKIRIHQDSAKNLTRFYSFPGTTISIPISFLKSVEFENELGAALSFEIANVMNRHLAQKVESLKAESQGKFDIFGAVGVFELGRDERKASIQVGTRLLYYAGYDLRGMASIFKRYPQCFSNISVDLNKKEVEFNVREAQRAKSEYMPSLNPIVRSPEFINMKKGIKRL